MQIPHACCKPWALPLFFLFLSLNFVRHCHRVRENEFWLRMRKCGLSEKESVLHESMPKIPRGVFPRVLGSVTRFWVRPRFHRPSNWPFFARQPTSLCTNQGTSIAVAKSCLCLEPWAAVPPGVKQIERSKTQSRFTWVRTEQLRRHLNPWLRIRKKHSWAKTTRTFWTTKNVLQRETSTEKGPSEKARKPPNDACAMVRHRIVKKSLCSIGWKEKRIMLYDRVALEKHIYVATRAEKLFPGCLPPCSSWRGPVFFRISTWQGIEELARGDRCWCLQGPTGYGRGPQACEDDIAINNYIRLGFFAACRDEKLLNVNNVKTFDEERIWFNRFT